MKTKEECYNEATLKSLGNNPQGTRMDVIYLAMDIYLEQFLNTFPTDAEIEGATESIINTWYNKNIRDDKSIEGAVMETVKWLRDKIVNYDGHKMVASGNSLREILPNPTEKGGCPCLYLKEPCHKNCTCVNGYSSTGCKNCATYGSEEQKQKAAIRLNNYRLKSEK